jgi:hypothetical protein
MYLAYYGLAEPPFSITPDPRFVFLSERHRDALAHLLFQPQHTLLVDDAGRLLADYVGRVERMQASFDDVCARIGIPARPLEQVNSTRRAGSYRDYYDDALVAGVASLYRRDLELFDYEF